MQNIKRLLFIEDSLSNKISYYHLLVLLFSLPFDQFYSHIILISFAVHTSLHADRGRWKKVFTWRTLALQSVFFVTLVGTVYSANKAEAYTELGRQAVILLIPVLFTLTSLNLKKYRDALLLGFSLCCTLTVVYLYYDAFGIIRYYKYPLTAIFTPSFTNHNFSDAIEMHATFFSLQVSVALVYMLSLLIKPGTVAGKMTYALSAVVLSAGLVQLESRSVLAATLIAVNLAIPFFILKPRYRLQYVAVCALITIGAVTTLLRSDTFRKRYLSDLETDLSPASAGETTDPRMARWAKAVELIRQSPVIGHGSGSEIAMLKEAYYHKKLYNSYLNSLNAHNEYLSFLLKSGLLGLLIYLATLYYGFKRAIAARNIMFLTFMLLIAVVSLSENVLDVDKGTIFYGLFFSFFALSNIELKPVKPDKYLQQVATLQLA